MKRSKDRAWRPKVKLLFITPEAEKVIEMAYRNCWQSKPKTKGVKARRKFLESCIKKGHLSPLEFANATFLIEGSRVFTHQLVRHRLASYAQESQRYVEVKDQGYFVIPPSILENEEALKIFETAIENSWQAYQKLLELKIPKEDARYLLANACKSKIMVSMNFRSWRHFLKLRCEKTAQWEIRETAMEILKILHRKAPGVFGDLYQKFIVNKGQGELWTERD